ncbi:MAG TPA: DinB family protein [Ohtaekwangia sp.]|uniref:DinB family protein n=1 Tax=Ohtaekwangia sp. TaxID=2066019 RepID=UPI002F946A7A
MSEKPEVWLRGPVEHIPALLQPVAHALLQAVEEADNTLKGFDDQYLWKKPAGMASVGFHLQHLTGVLDRLCTYARGEALNEEQLKALAAEGQFTLEYTSQMLLQKFREQVQRTLIQLQNTHEEDLLKARGVGRKQLPSTVQGLLFHAAEHTQRHIGQLLVTVKIASLV